MYRKLSVLLGIALVLCMSSCNNDTSSGNAPVIPYSGKAINLISPNGGENYTQGRVIPIIFLVNRDSIESNSTILIKFSPDAGLSFYDIEKNLQWGTSAFFSNDTFKYSWTIPDSVSKKVLFTETTVSTSGNQAMILVDAPYSANAASDQSDASFTIKRAQ